MEKNFFSKNYMTQRSRTLISICICLLLFITTATGQAFVPKKIVGKWEGTDTKNKKGSIEFLDSSQLKISIPDQGTYTCKYTFDTTKDPIWFDFSIPFEEQKQTMTCLLKFLDNNTLKWQVFLDGDRPNSFEKETPDNTIILKRKKRRS